MYVFKVFYVFFFKIQKNMTFYVFFELLHTFSPTVAPPHTTYCAPPDHLAGLSGRFAAGGGDWAEEE